MKQDSKRFDFDLTDFAVKVGSITVLIAVLLVAAKSAMYLIESPTKEHLRSVSFFTSQPGATYYVFDIDKGGAEIPIYEPLIDNRECSLKRLPMPLKLDERGFGVFCVNAETTITIAVGYSGQAPDKAAIKGAPPAKIDPPGASPVYQFGGKK